MRITLNTKEFHDAVSLRYDWEIDDIPSKCVCSERFDVNNAIYMKGEFVVQRHNERRDLENLAVHASQEARVDIHAKRFGEKATICLL